MTTEIKGAEPTNQQAKHLRALRDRARRIGKKSSSDLFELGAILEEAADLLRGRFGVWVEHECGIEPRTAHGYRRAHTRLGSHKNLLIERRVLPTVIVKLAGAGEDVRTEAIRMIDSGRRLRVRDVQSLIKDKSGADPDRHGPREARHTLGHSLKGLIANAVEDAETRIEAFAAQLEQGDLKGSDRAKVLKSEAAALAGALASMLDLLREKSGDAARPWSIMKDALADFSSTSRPRNMPAAAESVLMAYQAACHPKATATRTENKAVNSSVRPLSFSTSEKIRPAEHSLTALEVCAGAGGQALGIERAGFRHVALVEIDPHACETLRANFPGTNVIEQDLRAFDPAPYRGIDLLCGGVPCQPFSQAGKMKGSEDDRDLFMEAIRIIEQARPRAIMLENVTGLLQSRFDDYRLDILQHLRRLGYDAEWHTLNSADYGVPQRRVRSVLVGFRDNAMQRFTWPAPDQRYVDYPWTITSALVDMVASRDWKGVAKWVEMADALAPTIIGGSARKRGMDLGQANTGRSWKRLGINPKTVAKQAPGPDDEDLFLTLPMLAKLQSFPAGWKFQGPKLAIFKQIANAFPHVVALHLGCAIRSALTGIYVDPKQEMRLYTRRSRLSPKLIHLRSLENSGQISPALLPGPVRHGARLNLRKLTQDSDPYGPDDFD